MEDNRQYKTAILQLMAGEYYDYYSESELAEMFELKDADFTEDLFKKKLAEYREIEECYFNKCSL